MANDGPGVWVTFIAEFQRLIAGTVAKTARQCGLVSPSLIDDLVQETYLKLCANSYRILRDHRVGDPRSFYGLLQSVAMSTTLDYFRAAAADKRGGGQTPLSVDDETLRRRMDRAGRSATERATEIAEIDRLMGKCSPPETLERDRRIFWLYYRHGFSAKEIAAIPAFKLTAKGVESVLVRLMKQLRGFFSDNAKGAGS